MKLKMFCSIIYSLNVLWDRFGWKIWSASVLLVLFGRSCMPMSPSSPSVPAHCRRHHCCITMGYFYSDIAQGFVLTRWISAPKICTLFRWSVVSGARILTQMDPLLLNQKNVVYYHLNRFDAIQHVPVPVSLCVCVCVWAQTLIE